MRRACRILEKGGNHLIIRLCLTLLMAALMMPAAWANLDAGSKSELARYVLTVDALKRVTAIAQEGKAQGIPMDPYAGSLESMAVSIDSLAARIDTLSGAPSILSSHGMTARAYVMAGWVMITGRGCYQRPEGIDQGQAGGDHGFSESRQPRFLSPASARD